MHDQPHQEAHADDELGGLEHRLGGGDQGIPGLTGIASNIVEPFERHRSPQSNRLRTEARARASASGVIQVFVAYSAAPSAARSSLKPTTGSTSGTASAGKE